MENKNKQVQRETRNEQETTNKRLSKCEVIGSFYRYGYGGFLFWNWSHFSC